MTSKLKTNENRLRAGGIGAELEWASRGKIALKRGDFALIHSPKLESLRSCEGE